MKKLPSILKDCIITILLVWAFISFLFLPTIQGKEGESLAQAWLQIAGYFSFAFVGIIGLFDFLEDNGFSLFVPSYYSNNKEKRTKALFKETIQDFLDSETTFMQRYHENTAKVILTELGLGSQDPRFLRSKLLEAHYVGITDLESAKTRLEEILFSSSNIIIDLTAQGGIQRDNNLRYYMRIGDLMRELSLRDRIIDCMEKLIRCTFNSEELSKINVMITPTNGNYLLGLETCDRFSHCHFIKLIPPNSVVGDNFYEGTIPESVFREGVRILILHDVLATGRQIVDSVNSIKNHFRKLNIKNYSIEGVVSLVYRSSGEAKELPELKGYRLVNLLSYSEDEIKEKIERARNKS